MYRLGELKRSHRKRYLFLALFMSSIIIAGFVVLKQLKQQTTFSQTSPAITKNISYDDTNLTTFTEKQFIIKLPADWKPYTDSSQVMVEPQKPTFAWQGTSKDSTGRLLALYIDADMSKFAVNRELAVQASGSSLNVLGDVSENCTTFTGSQAGQSRSVVPAKWQGIDFLCDGLNYERDVVGIASPDGFNTVNLTGQTAGMHHIFFAYTDNSASPDYTIFTSALKTFALK